MSRAMTKTKKTIDETALARLGFVDLAVRDLRKRIVKIEKRDDDRAAHVDAAIKQLNGLIEDVQKRVIALEDTLNSKDFRLGRGTVDYVSDHLPAVVRKLHTMQQQVNGLVRDHTATANEAAL